MRQSPGVARFALCLCWHLVFSDRDSVFDAGEDLPPEGLVETSAGADEQLLAAHGYNFTDDALRAEGYQYFWEFARERARRASLLRSGGHWERMSSSLHLNYNFNGAGLPRNTNRWLYSDFISSKVAKDQYWATFQHRLGYVGYQSKISGSRRYSQFQCSNWDSESNNGQPRSKIIFCGKNVVCKRFGHEGSGWQTHLVDYSITPKDGQRFAFAVNYEDAGRGNARVTCWFHAPGFNNGRWFKQAVWEGPGGGGHGSHGSSFLEQFWFHRDETAKIREGQYGSIWGKTSDGPWKPVTSATSSTASKVRAGWRKVDWGVKNGRWYLAACGCKSGHLNECPGEAACTLSNSGGSGAKRVPTPTMPPSLAAFDREVVGGNPPPPSPSTPRPPQTRRRRDSPPPDNPVQNPGEDCWPPCGERGGLCSWCGEGNACCRQGWSADPPVCKTATGFVTSHHECVKPKKPPTRPPTPAPTRRRRDPCQQPLHRPKDCPTPAPPPPATSRRRSRRRRKQSRRRNSRRRSSRRRRGARRRKSRSPPPAGPLKPDPLDLAKARMEEEMSTAEGASAMKDQDELDQVT